MDGFAGPTLGMECAGVVQAVGTGVALKPGQAVCSASHRRPSRPMR